MKRTEYEKRLRRITEAALMGPYSPNTKKPLQERNMGYCRFENTFKDLQDCYENWDEDEDDELSDSERKYRKKMFELCVDIVDTYQDDYDEGLI